MKEHRISLAAGKRAEALCAFVLRFLLYHSAACLIMANFYTEGQMNHYIWLLGMLVPMCYLALVRKCAKYFVLALLLHIPVLFVGVLLGRDLGEKIVMTVFMVVMLVTSLYMCMSEKKNKENCPPISLLVILLICHFMGYYLQDNALVQVTHYEMMIYIVVFLVHESLHNTSEFIDMHKDTANFPIGQMTVINRLMVVLLLAVLVAAMLIFPRLQLDILLMPLVQALGKFFAWLLSFVNMPEASEQVQGAMDNIGGMPEELLGQTSETGLFWVIMEKIMIVLVIVGLAAAVIGGIAYLLYRLYKGFYAERKENADEREFLVGEIQWLPKGFFSGNKAAKEEKSSLNEKIRKLYRRFMKKSFKRKESVPATLTPEEMLLFLKERQERKMTHMTDGDWTRIREVYERARYGELNCTQEELDEMKRLVSSR